MLHHSGKLAIPHYHLFLLLHILHLVLFKSLQRQGELSISGNSRETAKSQVLENVYLAHAGALKGW